MQNISRMHEQQSSEYLISKVLYVILTKILSWIYHPMQVGLH